jgi:hypothetical protein
LQLLACFSARRGSLHFRAELLLEEEGDDLGLPLFVFDDKNALT